MQPPGRSGAGLCASGRAAATASSVQACIAGMEPWQAAIANRVDALGVKHVPVKFSFFKGTSLKPFRPLANIRRAFPGCA